MAGQVVLFTGGSWHFFIAQIQRRRYILEPGAQGVFTALCRRHLGLFQLVDQLLYLVCSEHLVAGLRRFMGHLRSPEAPHVLRATRLRPRARQALTTKGLRPDDGTDLVTVYVGVADLDTAGNVFNAAVYPAMDTKGQ